MQLQTISTSISYMLSKYWAARAIAIKLLVHAIV